VDLGFLGVDQQYDNSHMPHKKPQGGELTEVQKTDNRRLSQSRVVCEHAFAGVKHYGAVSAIDRDRQHRRFDLLHSPFSLIDSSGSGHLESRM